VGAGEEVGRRFCLHGYALRTVFVRGRVP